MFTEILRLPVAKQLWEKLCVQAQGFFFSPSFLLYNALSGFATVYATALPPHGGALLNLQNHLTIFLMKFIIN